MIAIMVVLVGLTPLTANAGNTLPADTAAMPQTGPTATPEDPIWLAFSAARSALEEKINQDLTYVMKLS